MSEHQVLAVIAHPQTRASAQSVLDCRNQWSTSPVEVFEHDGSRFLESGSRNFIDAWERGRISEVLPLPYPADGTLQGFLEFLGAPYGGCGMTGALLAHDRGTSKLILDSLGLRHSQSAAQVGLAIVGNESLVVGQPIFLGPSHDLEEAASTAFVTRVFRGLGLSGWAWITVRIQDQNFTWCTVEVVPDLSSGSGFLRSLQGRGLGLSEVLPRVLDSGRVRHALEAGLKVRFKDGL